MSSPFVAEIRAVGFNFAPTGWAECDGQILPLSQNTALFSLLGTTFGGDGRSTFGLPNLQGCVPMHAGQGPGLTLRDLGEQGGSNTVTLLTSEVPPHGHTFQGGTSDDQGTAANFAVGQGQTIYRATNVLPLAQMGGNMVQSLGGGQPHNNLMPFLTLNFIIALQGVFPPRS